MYCTNLANINGLHALPWVSSMDYGSSSSCYCSLDVATCSSLIRSTEFTGLLIGALGGYDFQHYDVTSIFLYGLY